jgi:Tfp pilus assembly protein PilV
MRRINVQGITLIETLLYTGLFSILMTGMMLSAWHFIKSTESTDRRTIIQEEASFLLRKFRWAMASAQEVSLPSEGRIAIRRYDGLHVDFCLDGDVVKMRATTTPVTLPCNDPTYVRLTTSNVSVDRLLFQNISGDHPGVMFVVEIHGNRFETKTYVR